MRRPKRTADQLTALIKERAAPFGQWPPKMTILLYPMNDTWEIMVSPGTTVQEEEFRITVLWIATQMAMEFDLRQQCPFLDKIVREIPFVAFEPVKLRPESGANLIKDASDAHAFMMHMNLALQNKPHWQVARRALGQFTASQDAELKAWRAFRDAAKTEGWLVAQMSPYPLDKTVAWILLRYPWPQFGEAWD